VTASDSAAPTTAAVHPRSFARLTATIPAPTKCAFGTRCCVKSEVSLLPAKISDDVDAKGGSNYPPGIRNTAPFDVLGLPTISVPCGFTTSGLQIAGDSFADAAVLTLAHAYERETKWHARRPTLSPG